MGIMQPLHRRVELQIIFCLSNKPFICNCGNVIVENVAFVGDFYFKGISQNSDLDRISTKKSFNMGK